jgi:hypothetical protein
MKDGTLYARCFGTGAFLYLPLGTGATPRRFAAYGWEPDLSDDNILARLLALNLSRKAAEGGELSVVAGAQAA